MTETTSVEQPISERRVYSQTRPPRPGSATLISQAVVGCFFGTILAVLVWSLFRYYNDFVDLSLTFLVLFALATGLPSALLIWMGNRLAKRPLNVFNRCLIAVLVIAAGWFVIWLFLVEWTPSLEAQFWTLEAIVVTGILMGLVTGSRLRLWRELVRQGEANGTVPRIFAALTGLVLRVFTVLLFLSSLSWLISVLQLADPMSEYGYTALIWTAAVFGHSALSVVVLFVRMRFRVTVLLTAIAATPVIAGFRDADLHTAARCILAGYLGLWSLFLLTRWRQNSPRARSSSSRS